MSASTSDLIFTGFMLGTLLVGGIAWAIIRYRDKNHCAETKELRRHIGSMERGFGAIHLYLKRKAPDGFWIGYIQVYNGYVSFSVDGGEVIALTQDYVGWFSCNEFNGPPPVDGGDIANSDASNVRSDSGKSLKWLYDEMVKCHQRNREEEVRRVAEKVFEQWAKELKMSVKAVEAYTRHLSKKICDNLPMGFNTKVGLDVEKLAFVMLDEEGETIWEIPWDNARAWDNGKQNLRDKNDSVLVRLNGLPAPKGKSK